MPILPVDDTTFRRVVLRAALPVLVCFHAPECATTAVLFSTLTGLSERYAARLNIAHISCETGIAEQYGVDASPTLLVFRHGNEVLRSIGFLPEALLALLAEDALTADGEHSRMWAPLEACFEEAALLPMLTTLGCSVERQHRILNWPGNTRNGRIDLLVHDAAGLLTLIESKRALRSESDLRAATKQAQSYARAMGTPSFVVAAPAGLWVYARHDATCVGERFFSWLDLHASVAPLGEVLLALRG